MYLSWYRNQGVTDGVCTDIPAVDYSYPLWWVDDSSYLQYEEFFNWSIWGYTSTVSGHIQPYVCIYS